MTTNETNKIIVEAKEIVPALGVSFIFSAAIKTAK